MDSRFIASCFDCDSERLTRSTGFNRDWAALSCSARDKTYAPDFAVAALRSASSIFSRTVIFLLKLVPFAGFSFDCCAASYSASDIGAPVGLSAPVGFSFDCCAASCSASDIGAFLGLSSPVGLSFDYCAASWSASDIGAPEGLTSALVLSTGCYTGPLGLGLGGGGPPQGALRPPVEAHGPSVGAALAPFVGVALGPLVGVALGPFVGAALGFVVVTVPFVAAVVRDAEPKLRHERFGVS